MRFSRQKYCNGYPFPSPRYLLDPGIERGSPALQADSLLSEPPGKPSFLLAEELMGEAGSYRKPGDSPQGAGVVLSPGAWVEDGVFGRRKRREDMKQ